MCLIDTCTYIKSPNGPKQSQNCNLLTPLCGDCLNACRSNGEFACLLVWMFVFLLSFPVFLLLLFVLEGVHGGLHDIILTFGLALKVLSVFNGFVVLKFDGDLTVWRVVICDACLQER